MSKKKLVYKDVNEIIRNMNDILSNHNTEAKVSIVDNVICPRIRVTAKTGNDLVWACMFYAMVNNPIKIYCTGIIGSNYVYAIFEIIPEEV